MAVNEAEYLLPSVDSLDGPLELGCGIIAPREDSDEDDSELIPALLPPPPSPSSVAQEEEVSAAEFPLPQAVRLRQSSNVTWVHISNGNDHASAIQTITNENRGIVKLEPKKEIPDNNVNLYDPLRCEHCSFRARSRHSLNNHHRQRHGQERFRRMRQCQVCPVTGCQVTKFHSSRMVQHLNAVHGARIQKIQLFFNCLEEFLRWKQAEERKVGVTFTKRTGDRHGLYGRSTNYTCSRFGTQMHRYSNTGASSSRVLRLGYFQTDDYCPSRMNVVFYNSRLVVAYFRKHSHDVAAGPDYWVDLKSLPLSVMPPPDPGQPEESGAVARAAEGPRQVAVETTSARVYSSLCDTLRAQMAALAEGLRAGIPESLLEAVMDLHNRQARLLQQLGERRGESRVFPLVLRAPVRKECE